MKKDVCSWKEFVLKTRFFAYRLRTTSARKELGIGLIDDGIVEI